MIGSFQGLAQERLVTWEKGTPDTAVSQIFWLHMLWKREYSLNVHGIDKKKKDKDFQS